VESECAKDVLEQSQIVAIIAANATNVFLKWIIIAHGSPTVLAFTIINIS
jgi:hypothetical protein